MPSWSPNQDPPLTRKATPFAVMLPFASTRNTTGVPAALAGLTGMPSTENMIDPMRANTNSAAMARYLM